MAAKRTLLESDSEGEDQAAPRFKINDEYAKRLAHNKKREDLHRLQELQKKGLVDSDSEDDEDEDEDGVFPQRTEVKIFETLSRIKKKDPSIYQSDVKFFEEGEEDEDEDEEGKNASGKDVVKKPVFLKDVVAQHALENPDDSDDDHKRRTFKTYNEEQQELKDAFLKGVSAAVEDDDGEENLFKVRKKSKEELEQENAETEQSNKDLNIGRRLDDYFGKDDDLDENDKFLKNYLLNQGWVDKDKDKIPSYEDIVGSISEDEAELDKQDNYEAKFNFRFEEGAGSRVLGHARFAENSVRKLPEKRKEQRKNKQARLSELELARQEEVKRLKNVKKKEIMERMSKIKAVAGITSLEKLNEDDLEEDFDPAEYDKKMSEVFSEEAYYNNQDPDAKFHSDDDEADILKPDFDAEDEALGLPVGWDGREKEGFAAVHEKQKSQDQKNMLLQEKAEIEKKLEEYYKLDYEDMVGDLPTRFKYTQVKANNFGLNAAQILDAEDSELNQYVSLKALAPYRTEEWIPRHKHQRLTKKERKRRALDQVPSLEDKSKKQEVEGTEVQRDHNPENSPEKKKKKKKQTESMEPEHAETGKSKNQEVEGTEEQVAQNPENTPEKKKRKKQNESADLEHAETGKSKKQEIEGTEEQVFQNPENTSEKKKRKKQKESTEPEGAETDKTNKQDTEEQVVQTPENTSEKKKRKKQKESMEAETDKSKKQDTEEQVVQSLENTSEKKKRKKQKEFTEPETDKSKKQDTEEQVVQTPENTSEKKRRKKQKESTEPEGAETDKTNKQDTEEQVVQTPENTSEKTKRKKQKESTEPEHTKQNGEVAEVEDGKNVESSETGDQQSSKKKRKRKKQGLNMSRSRLISYGKIDLPKRKAY